MDRNIVESLLDRYLNGQTSRQENELIENWLKANNNSHSPWQHLSQSAKDRWREDIFSNINSSIEVTEPKLTAQSRGKKLWTRIGAAAAILIVCCSLYLAFTIFDKRLDTPQLITLSAPAQQKKMITLEDGSQVWINAGSALKYSKTFSGDKREVYLSGEAYFDIYHDPSKPFVIHTGRLSTTVLGTAFNIKEDKKSHTIQVTVTRGKVSVSDGQRQLGVLHPNQQISYNTLNAEALQANVDANRVVSWQRSDLLFDDVSFGEAALRLEKHFDVKITFSNPKLKICRFTGTSLNGEALEKILDAICAINNATYRINSDGSYLIDGQGC